MADSKNVLTATDTTFDQEILKSSNISVVDFWAEWCGPCRMLAPTIESLAEEFNGKVKVFKMDVDQNPETPTKYQVKGIPTVIVFRGGEVIDRLVGNQPKDVFVQTLQKHLSKTPA
jgi:thioredoxin 1